MFRLGIETSGLDARTYEYCGVDSPTLTTSKDKQAVEAYKADIKAQLTRAGLIRGQPRSSILQATTSSSSVFTTQQYQGSASGSRLPQISSDPGPPNLTFADPMQGQGESPTMMSMLGGYLLLEVLDYS